MRVVVLDATIGVELALRSETAIKVAKAIGPKPDSWVPDNFFTESAGVLRRLAQRKEISQERAAQAMTRLLSLRVQHVSTRPFISEAWTLRENVTMADAVYVVLARHLGAELATMDERLRGAPGLDIGFVEI